MAKPYSEDLRRRGGRRCRCELPRNGKAIQHLREQRCTVGAAVPADRERLAKAMGGERHSRLRGERDWLLALVAAAPDLPLHDIRRALAARHVHVGYGTIWRFFATEKISFKKNRARQRAGSA